MNWEKVCKLNDIIPNTGACVLVNDKQIALFRLDDSIYAVDNLDPFSNASVMSRGIVGDIDGNPIVASPVFKNRFNLSDGQCLEDENITLKTYQTRLTDDAIEISIA